MKTEIVVRVKGSSPQDALENAKRETEQMGPMTEFHLLAMPEGKEPMDYASDLLDHARDYATEDGYALVCVDMGNGEYLFAGKNWAAF